MHHQCHPLPHHPQFLHHLRHRRHRLPHWVWRIRYHYRRSLRYRYRRSRSPPSQYWRTHRHQSCCQCLSRRPW